MKEADKRAQTVRLRQKLCTLLYLRDPQVTTEAKLSQLQNKRIFPLLFSAAVAKTEHWLAPFPLVDMWRHACVSIWTYMHIVHMQMCTWLCVSSQPWCVSVL